MYITYELLKSKDACEKGLEWFKKTFPNGCELDEAINKLVNSKDGEEDISGFVWWFYNNIQQDSRLYKLVGVSWSNGVDRSDGVSWSNGVDRSDGVSWSNGVDRSDGVYRSDGVSWSNGVSWSDGVYGSNGVYGSFGILNSRGVDHALFLANKPRQCTIFGVKVSEDRFNEVYRTLMLKLNGWRPTFNNIKALYLENGSDWELTPIQNAQALSKEEAWADMPKEAIAYVRSLPEFDAVMFEEITGIKTEKVERGKNNV